VNNRETTGQSVVMTNSKLSEPGKKKASSPVSSDKEGVTSSPPRGRGKMYWKFAAIEGWKANKAEPSPDISQKKK